MNSNKPVGSSETRGAQPSFKPDSQITGRVAESSFANKWELTWWPNPRKAFDSLIRQIKGFFVLNSTSEFPMVDISKLLANEVKAFRNMHNQGKKIKEDFTTIGDELLQRFEKKIALGYTVRSSYDSETSGSPTETKLKELAKSLETDKMDFAKDMISAILGRLAQPDGSILDTDIVILKENVDKLKDVDKEVLNKFIESEKARIIAAPSDASKKSIIHKPKTTEPGGTKRDTGWRIV